MTDSQSSSKESSPHRDSCSSYYYQTRSTLPTTVYRSTTSSVSERLHIGDDAEQGFCDSDGECVAEYVRPEDYLDERREAKPSTRAYRGCEVDQSCDSLASAASFPDSQRPAHIEQQQQQPWLAPTIGTQPASSQDFAQLFPSSRGLRIRHDDATVDGNMNLRVDTAAMTSEGHACNFVLFHLRMYDLKSRTFSLRRYCRDSGREICHTSRGVRKTSVDDRTGVPRTFSSALAAIKSKADSLHLNSSSGHSSAEDQEVTGASDRQRHDSGYAEGPLDDAEAEETVASGSPGHGNSSDPIGLDFSNYSHIDVRRRGLKGRKRYDFEYWGQCYSWTISAQKVGPDTEVSYSLERRDNGHVVARILPQPLSEAEARLEQQKGGWVAPCWMRITDEKLLAERDAELADVIISTGLVALVDDTIRRHFHEPSGVRQLVKPLSKLGGKLADSGLNLVGLARHGRSEKSASISAAASDGAQVYE